MTPTDTHTARATGAWGYAVALAAAAAMVWLRWLLDPWLGDYQPLTLLFGAVALAVWLGGAGPAALAAVAGYLACDWLFIEPRGVLGLADVRSAIGATTYAVSCVIVIGFGEAMRRARRRADRESAERGRAEHEAQQLNRELQGRLQQWQTLLDLLPVGVWFGDRDCQRITGNKAAYEMLGLPAGLNVSLSAGEGERLRGAKCMADGRELRAEDLPMQRAARTGEVVRGFEHDVVFDDGRVRSVYANAAPLHDDDGRVQGVVGVYVDISARQRAERETRTQARMLRLLWEAASVLLGADDPNRMLRGLFERVAPHLGLDVMFNYMVDARGQALELECAVGIDDDTARSITPLEFGQAICGTVALRREPLVVTCIQASELPMAQLVKSMGIRAYACNPLMAGDRLLGTLSFASRTRDELDGDDIEFLQTISRYVAVAYERIRLLDQLREADRRKDEFIATLAHELRNPLAPIRNAAHIVKVKAGDGASELRWACEVIERQLAQMARLLDDLLDVSRISRRQVELHRRALPLAAVIESAVETSRPLVEAGGHALEVELPAQPLLVSADPVRLAQVFANLLNNAAKYTDRGGRIRLSARHSGRDAVVTVQDNGIGIAPEMLPRIFDLFTQAQPARTRAQGGLGIGLSLVKGLVELHGGTIEVRSDGPGRGSTFTVRLPLACDELHAAEAGNAPPSGAAASATPAGRRILVADDLADNADSLAALLRMLGHDVRVAYDGEAALELALAFHPEFALLDLGMPGLDGVTLCRRLRAQPWARQTCFIALTGWGQDEDRLRTREAGFDHHLVKPTELAALVRVIAQHPGAGAGSPRPWGERVG